MNTESLTLAYDIPNFKYVVIEFESKNPGVTTRSILCFNFVVSFTSNCASR